MKRAIFFITLCLTALAAAVDAKEAQPLVDDPVLEERVMALAENLRCLVCQNETLAASRAPLAADLRQQIREQMLAGKSDDEIVTFMTDRYGDFVLFRPPVKAKTYLLWFGPFVLLAAGLVIQFLYLKRRRLAKNDEPLSEAERSQVSALLGEERQV